MAPAEKVELMSKSRFSKEQIIRIWNQAEAGQYVARATIEEGLIRQGYELGL